MRASTWVVLGIATLVVVGGSIHAVTQRQQSTAASTVGGPLLPQLGARVNDVAGIAVRGAKGDFRIVRGADDVWTLDAKSGFPAATDTVKKAVVGLAELRPIEPRTGNPDLYDRIGVGEPGKDKDAVLLTLSDAAGATIGTIIVGKTKTYELSGKPAEIYVRIPDQKQSWLATARLAAPGDALGWVDRNISKIGRDRMDKITISHPGDAPRVQVVRDGANPREFTLAEVPAGQKLKSNSETGSVAGGLDFLTFEDVKKDDAVQWKDPVIAVYSTLDGIDITVRSVEIESAWWSKLNVAFNADRAAAYKPVAEAGKEPPAHDPAKVAAEAEALGKRMHGWAFQISAGNIRPLVRKLGDMIEPVEEKKDGKNAG
jgi:hypothetical protein